MDANPTPPPTKSEDINTIVAENRQTLRMIAQQVAFLTELEQERRRRETRERWLRRLKPLLWIFIAWLSWWYVQSLINGIKTSISETTAPINNLLGGNKATTETKKDTFRLFPLNTDDGTRQELERYLGR